MLQKGETEIKHYSPAAAERAMKIQEVNWRKLAALFDHAQRLALILFR